MGNLITRIVVPTMLLGAGLFWATGILRGQENAASEHEGGEPRLKLSPEKTLEQFEPAANAEYELGPGDEISLEFPGHPELGGKKIVGPDGRITLSFVGPLMVADKTRDQAAKLMIAALTPYYKDLTVTVSIDKYGSNRVIVLGAVQHPGVLYFDDTPTLLDVIARGGLLGGASAGAAAGPAGSSSGRQGIPERCAIYRGNDQVVWVDLRQMLQSGSSMADLRLKRNDVVFVPAQQEVFVSVLGNVMHAGAVPLSSDSTLVSVLAQSGGLAEGAGSNIQVIQPSSGRTLTIPFKSLLTLNGADEVKLHAGDVIYVPKSGFYKSTYVLQRISPVTSLLALSAIAH